MKTITIVAIIAAVAIVGAACIGIPLSGVLNGGTTGSGGDDPVQPTETPVEPTPTETPTVTPSTPMSYFSGGGSKSDSGSSSNPDTCPLGGEHALVGYEPVDGEQKHIGVCGCGHQMTEAIDCTFSTAIPNNDGVTHRFECTECDQILLTENCFTEPYISTSPLSASKYVCECDHERVFVASIGTAPSIAYYPTVLEAFKASNGQVVNLTRDMTTEESIPAGMPVVLNTTGKTIRLNYSSTDDIKIQKYGWFGSSEPYSHVKAVVEGVTTDVTDELVEDPNSDLLYIPSSTTVTPPATATVATAEQLKDILTDCTDAGSGNNIVEIAGDVTLAEGETWTPITVDGYNGADVITINGNGHTIKGLTAPLFAGGFAGGSGIVINDLTIANSQIVSTNALGSGAFIECVDSMDVITLKNCHLKDSTVSGSRTGGLIGWTAGYDNVNDGAVKTYVTITGCSVVDCTIQNTFSDEGNTPNTESVGAINGHAGNNHWTFTTIENCVVKNNILKGGSGKTGVILGTANVGEVTISGCTMEGNTVNGAASDAVYGRTAFGTTGKLTIDGVAVQ